MAAPRRPLIAGECVGSAEMQTSHRTWRWFVTAPPQAGQVHVGSAVAAVGSCRAIDDVAADRADALRAFTTAYAVRVRLRVSGVAAE
jgi:hypothetical protein